MATEWKPETGNIVKDARGVVYRVLEVEDDSVGYDVLVRPTVSDVCPPFWLGSNLLTLVSEK